MKILLTTSFYPPFHIGGDAVHVKNLAESLDKTGHEVHVMHSIDAYNLKRKEIKKSPESRITIHPLKSPIGILEPILNYSFNTQRHTLNSFKRIVQKHRFDIVHHHNISLLGYNILRKQGDYKNIYTAHDYWLLCHKYDMLKNMDLCNKKECLSCCIKEKRIYQIFRNSREFRKSLEDIGHIITPSRFMGEVFKREFSKVNIIPNFITENRIGKTAIKDYFIYAGVLERHKGILNLIKAFSKTEKKLLLAGTGSLETEIRKKKTDNIELLGWKSHQELLPLIASSQALILPSICLENNPLVALEAMSVGTPVIGSETGGIPEIVKKIDPSLVFKKDSVQELKTIIENFDRKKYPAETIKEIFNKNYSQDMFMKKYKSLLEK